MLTVFLSTLNDVGQGPPKLIQYLENQPGLTRLSLDLKYKDKDNSAKLIKAYEDLVSKFLSTYDSEDNGKAMCNSREPMAEGTSCKFDYNTHLGECAKKGNNSYGLKDGMPCIYVKMNKIYGWSPKPTDGTPGYLKLSCDGADHKMYPKDGFLISGFPYRGQGANFNLPVVAIKMNASEILNCKLEGPGIVTSESFVPHRAYGVIRIV